jgi:hypothetical protein
MLLSRHTRRREFITLLGGASSSCAISIPPPKRPSFFLASRAVEAVNADGLLLGISFSIPLIFRLLSVAFGRAELRSPRRDCIAIPLSKPEHRAEALLNEWLCQEQRATLERHGYFEARGSHTSKRYRIRRGRNMNIEELGEDGAHVAPWCFGPVGHLPLGDVMLAQKLALETEEQAALRVANRLRQRY